MAKKSDKFTWKKGDVQIFKSEADFKKAARKSKQTMAYNKFRNSYLNCNKRIFPGVGQFDIPMMEPVEVDFEGVELIGFNYAKGEKHPENKIVHFYVDDYQFNRVWNQPDQYIGMLSRFRAVLSPDFSLYDDFPTAVNIFNHYRKQWCSAYWQERGITVIPTICWGEPDSYSWCFDGVPKNSLVSISTVGGFGNHRPKDTTDWVHGYEECLRVLQPSQVLLFGKYYPEIKKHPNTVIYANSNLERKKKLSRKRIDKGGIEILSMPEEFEKLEENDEQKK